VLQHLCSPSQSKGMSGPPPPPPPPSQDPISQAMQFAAEHPEATQKAATVGVAGVEATKRADPSGEGSIESGAKVLAGAAVVGGMAVGAVAGSLTLGVVGAGAAAYAATRKDKIGDAARATGQAAVAVGGKADAINREHKITEKISNAAKSSFTAAKSFDQKHGISTKAAEGVTATMNGLAKKVNGDGTPSSVAATAAPAVPVVAGTVVPPPPPPPPEGHVGVFRPGEGSTTVKPVD